MPADPATLRRRLLRAGCALAYGAAVAAAASVQPGCAIVGRPRGGPVDSLPPRLDSAASTPNYRTDFRPDELVLVFDEYVVLKSASREIVLTPTPESGRPAYAQRGREVRVDLSEVTLRDSTTYQLQFGEAVQDFNEGNPAPALRYVWSTGGYLDSLTVRGQVLEHVGGEPAADALVGLYRSLGDTAVTALAPDYFARTDSAGRFRLDYLAPGRYQLFAYADANGNYRLNAGAEPVAFLDGPIAVAPGAPDTSYALRLSAERPPLFALRAELLYPGLLAVQLNQPAPLRLGLELPGGLTERLRYASADTLFALVADGVSGAWPDSLAGPLVVAFDGETDTVDVREARAAAPPPLRQAGRGRAVTGRIDVEVPFNQPLASVDASRVEVAFAGDSTAVGAGTWGVSATDPRALTWVAPRADTAARFRVSWLPGAVRTPFDSTNRDTLTAELDVRPDRDFGAVDLLVEGRDSGQAYVVELVDERGQVERTVRVPADAPDRVQLPRVPSGRYVVRFVDDRDGDGAYTPGSRRLLAPPERVRTFPFEQVRADWLVEHRMVLTPAVPDQRDALEDAPEDPPDVGAPGPDRQ